MRRRSLPAVGLVLGVLLALSSGAGVALGWSPLSVSAPCSTDGQTLVWTVQGSAEANLDIQFADNAQFTNYSSWVLDSQTYSVQVTTAIIPEVWVRWTSDQNVVSTGYAPDGCQPPENFAPAGSIGGPCYDASYYGVFDNSATTTQAVQFRFRWRTVSGWHTKSKIVPAGMTYTTWVHWAKPGTVVRVGYKDPDTGIWINLAHVTAVKGWYPACQYTPGWPPIS